MTDDGSPEPPSGDAMTKHLYGARTARGEVTVYQGALQGHAGSRKFSATGSITLRWAPSSALLWSAESVEPDVAFDPTTGTLVLEEVRVTVPAAQSFLPVLGHRVRRDEVRWRGRGPLARTLVGDGQAENLLRATFLVANLPASPIGSVLRDGDLRYAGRTALTGSGWQVTLDAAPSCDEIERDLRENGGHAVTHVGGLERQDGGVFTAVELSEILSALRYALSLACGRWVPPVLPVAYDDTGEPAWSEWAAPDVSPWRTSFALTDSHHPSQLQELFERITAVWPDPLKQEVVRRSIYYLIDANDPRPLEIAVSSAQAGLELLAWTELVEDRRIHTARAYRDQPAQDSIRELLNLHSVDPTFPAGLPRLASIAAKLAGHPSAADGPAVLTRMRNGIAHPTRTKPKFDLDEWYDAWCLARHYLQLGILAYLGYQGSHCDPLVKVRWTGQVEPVPWNQ